MDDEAELDEGPKMESDQEEDPKEEVVGVGFCSGFEEAGPKTESAKEEEEER